MAGYHTVVQGEHACGIAASYGFSDYQTVWNDPHNAQLKNLRENPNVLFPGDLLYIPDLEKGEYTRPTDQRHKFVVKRHPLKLRLTLVDQFEKPIAHTACLLMVDSDSYNLTTDGSGKIELPIPLSASKGTLIVQDARETPYAGMTIPVKIGHLDPVEEITGQQGRLNNLGYYAGDIDGKASPDLESAVEEFQCDNGLTVDGRCGPNTQAKLKQVYGC